MSLLHADKVSCNLKQNQGVASLTNFCDAEPIKKKSHMEKIEEITANSSSVRYFEFDKQQKEGKIL